MKLKIIALSISLTCGSLHAAIVSKTLIADGQVNGPVIQENIYTSSQNVVPMIPAINGGVAGERLSPNVGNEAIIVFHDTGKPADYDPNDNRHTIAMDVAFSGGYMSHDSTHMGLISRHAGAAYAPHIRGANRGGAIIAGSLFGKPGYTSIEEIEIQPDYNFVMQGGAQPLQEDKWYRLVLDSIVLGGGVAHEIRVIDKATGEVVHSTGTMWSNFWYNYSDGLDAGKVVLFNINTGAGYLYFTNLRSYWSLGGEWVANP